MNELRFIGVHRDTEDDKVITIMGATPKGSIRKIRLTEREALTVIRDIALHLRVGKGL